MKKNCFAGLWLSVVIIVSVCAENVEMKPSAPWIKQPDGTFSIDYPGKQWPQLHGVFPVKADTYYAIDFEAKTTPGNPLGVFCGIAKHEMILMYPGDGKWNRYRFYQRAETSGIFNLRFYFNPGASVSSAVRNIGFSPISALDNYLPDGDFESGNTMPNAWLKGLRDPRYSAKVISSEQFFSGIGSMQMDILPGNYSSLCSIPLPLEMGKSAIFSFFCRAPEPCNIEILIDCYGVFNHAGNHLIKRRQIAVGTEWKSFSIRLDVPGDATGYPDLAQGFCRLKISSQEKSPRSVQFDDMKFSLQPTAGL